MKNKDRIEQLEKQVEMLINRVHILEMKVNPLVPAAAPVEWPSWKPFWINGPDTSPMYGPGTVTCRNSGKVENFSFPNKAVYPSSTPARFH